VDRDELKKMIADYMEKGFLENILDMFRHDRSLYAMTGDLLRDERLRVRIGVTALIEELSEERPEESRLAAPSLLQLLNDNNPTIRGDAAYLIGLIGGKDNLESLKPLLNDTDPQVVEIVKEILDQSDE
jgi:HEAT repeat protein